jgi:Recombination endonuclease VII
MPYADPAKNLACKLRWQKEHPENFKRYYERHKKLHMRRCENWRRKNRDKHLRWRRKYAKAKRDLWYGYSLKSLYGISVDDYKNLLKKQKGRCAICRKTPKQARCRRLHVDHNHKTKDVRGLLCQVCNLRVGTLESFPLVKKAIAYLKEHNGH